jgi:glutaredoxin
MFRVFGRPDCSFCRKAKEALEAKNIEFKFYNLDTLEGRNAFAPYAMLVPASHKTVPIIFIDAQFIGGFSDLNKYI